MRTQKQIISGQCLLAFIAIAALAGCSDGKKEESLKFSDCPAVVQKTIIEYSRGIQFSEVKMETKKDSRIVYEAKGKGAAGNKVEVKVAADGSLVGFKNETED